MKTISVNNLEFDVHDGPIGIAHSGGADSAIMLYILMHWAEGPIHVYTCANSLKGRTNPHVALDVIGKLLDITDRQDVYHHTFFTEVQTVDTLIKPLSKFINDHELKILYTATTSFPPDNILWDKNIFTTECKLYHERGTNVVRPVYKGKFYIPWWNRDKKFVAGVYRELNLTDVLFPLTRSCEDIQLRSGHCGKCWWCEERQWAFGRL
jgi:7-cyano-7-deazaguanine synthase in queuosine biosynthesis